jgi:hypothetical protein
VLGWLAIIQRAALLVSILQFALSSSCQIPSIQPRQRAGSVAADLQVLEAGAKAALEKDIIRVTLPLSAVPGPGARVVVWLASPKNVRSGETVATVSASGRAASATMHWPMDARGVREDDIGWYRIGYRVDVNVTECSRGVISVGAITINLMDLRLAYPKMIEQAHGVSARVIAVNPVTGKALPGVNVKATLSDDEDGSRKKGFTRVATTARNGEAIRPFRPWASRATRWT